MRKIVGITGRIMEIKNRNLLRESQGGIFSPLWLSAPIYYCQRA